MSNAAPPVWIRRLPKSETGLDAAHKFMLQTLWAYGLYRRGDVHDQPDLDSDLAPIGPVKVYPSRRTLMFETGQPLGTVKSQLARLAELGWIRRDDGSRMTLAWREPHNFDASRPVCQPGRLIGQPADRSAGSAGVPAGAADRSAGGRLIGQPQTLHLTSNLTSTDLPAVGAGSATEDAEDATQLTPQPAQIIAEHLDQRLPPSRPIELQPTPTSDQAHQPSPSPTPSQAKFALESTAPEPSKPTDREQVLEFWDWYNDQRKAAFARWHPTKRVRPLPLTKGRDRDLRARLRENSERGSTLAEQLEVARHVVAVARSEINDDRGEVLNYSGRGWDSMRRLADYWLRAEHFSRMAAMVSPLLADANTTPPAAPSAGSGTTLGAFAFRFLDGLEDEAAE